MHHSFNRKSPFVSTKGSKMISCYNSVSDKEMAIKQILMAKEIDASQSVFLGNDINDLPAFKAVNLRLAVADSHYNILNAADYSFKAWWAWSSERSCKLY